MSETDPDRRALEERLLSLVPEWTRSAREMATPDLRSMIERIEAGRASDVTGLALRARYDAEDYRAMASSQR